MSDYNYRAIDRNNGRTGDIIDAKGRIGDTTYVVRWDDDGSTSAIAAAAARIEPKWVTR